MSLLAIDPSLASTGWAVFDRDRAPDVVESLRSMRATGLIKTDSDTSIEARLLDLVTAVRSIVEKHDVGTVAVEVSAVAGAYGRHSGNRGISAGVLLYHQATGAIIATVAEAVGPGNVLRVHADTRKKAVRHMFLRAQCLKAGVELPTGPRGGVLPDVWDAMWTGARALSP